MRKIKILLIAAALVSGSIISAGLLIAVFIMLNKQTLNLKN